jgi:hypothetical protein
VRHLRDTAVPDFNRVVVSRPLSTASAAVESTPQLRYSLLRLPHHFTMQLQQPAGAA